MRQPALTPHRPEPDPAGAKFNRLLREDHPLCRDDLVWILDYIKQKAAENDPVLLGLHQPRLLRNFHFFAELALMLLSGRPEPGQEQHALKSMLKEAGYGLYEEL